MALNMPTIGTVLIGLAAVIGATVAVCLGHISEATYIALVGPIAGVGVGAGVHAQGVTTATKAGSSGGISP